MSEEIAVSVQNVSKSFKLPHEKHGSVKSAFISLFRGKTTYEKQHVLKDISFEIKKGEFFGIVGRNGSGKSTLLKLLAGIYSPDSGHIQVNGKLTPFIELGVGFNPELTGRENVFLNGALLGFSRKEMEDMYDEIVEFAELEKFMDQKLKNYSSGMQVRLAFSIAIRTESDLLILDEVLAVGDEAFQSKCYEYFYKLKDEERTVILVTHDMNAVTRFCDSAMVIHDSQKIMQGSTEDATFQYMKLNFPKVDLQQGKNDRLKIEVLNDQGKPANAFKSGEKIKVRLEWQKEPAIKNAGVAIVRDDNTYIYGTNTIIDGVQIRSNKITYELENNFRTGSYHLQVGLFGDTDQKKIAYVDKAAAISIKGNEEWQGIADFNHKWTV